MSIRDLLRGLASIFSEQAPQLLEGERVIWKGPASLDWRGYASSGTTYRDRTVFVTNRRLLYELQSVRFPPSLSCKEITRVHVGGRGMDAMVASKARMGCLEIEFQDGADPKILTLHLRSKGAETACSDALADWVEPGRFCYP